MVGRRRPRAESLFTSLRKRRSDKRYLPWERENLEDPVEHEWSIVQMDVTYVDSQCYVFIKKMVGMKEGCDV